MPRGAFSMLRKFRGLYLIILGFCILLSDYLKAPTYILVGITLIAVTFNIQIKSYWRSLLSIIIFISYYLIYGKVFDPEIGLNFLVSVLSIKVLEEEERRDQFMIFYGLLLLIGAGSLFEKTLPYASYTILSLGYLISVFYRINHSIMNREFSLKFVFFVIPVSALIFLLAPRMSELSSFNPVKAQEGAVVGYTTDVRISELESLQQSSRKMFDAKISGKISPNALYWRGNILDFNDGWNWVDRHRVESPKEPHSLSTVRQEIFLYEFHDYFIGLDTIQTLTTQRFQIPLSTAQTARQLKSRFIARYEVSSADFTDSEVRSIERRNFLSEKETQLILKLFPERELKTLLQNVQQYFQKNQFSYSYNPGRIQSLSLFLNEKKIGFCSHYASALGLILRAHGYPARLVSGYMGGRYNQFGEFYEVTQNDAHVWVEYYDQDRWMRVDPTLWIAPSRIELGGELYSLSLQSTRGNLLSSYFSKYYLLVSDWISQWNYDFYFWLDSFDYQFQLNFFERLKLNKKMTFPIIIIGLVVIMLVYYFYQFFFSHKKERASPYSVVWIELNKKIHHFGFSIDHLTIAETREILRSKPELLVLFDEVILALYGSSKVDWKSLLRRIKKF